VTEEQDKQTVSAPAGLPADARQVLADQLVEQAKTDGISLIGPGGLLSDITKRVLETGLEVELTDHLGYEKHSAEGRNGGNSPGPRR
jgi:transposase-like protein